MIFTYLLIFIYLVAITLRLSNTRDNISKLIEQALDKLDADEAPLYSKKLKEYMAADIVQYVPFAANGTQSFTGFDERKKDWRLQIHL